jgi:hypothetical protein
MTTHTWRQGETTPAPCTAVLHIADDFGDNWATMRCQLDAGHPGPHRERYEHRDNTVVVTWEGDDTPPPEPPPTREPELPI